VRSSQPSQLWHWPKNLLNGVPAAREKPQTHCRCNRCRPQLSGSLIEGHSLHRICAGLYEAHRFDLRFFRRFPADLSIKKSSSFLPPLIAATSQKGFAPRPAQVSPEGLRYFGGTFLPFNVLRPPRTTLAPPTTAPIFCNCCSISARRSKRVSSTCFRRSMSASTFIPDRFTFGIVISGAKTI
jgi:hypothetical protein